MSRSLALAAALAALLVVALGSSAHAARTCSPPKYPGQGYFTRLQVSGVSCATGRKVTLAHYRCRTRHGKKGRCSSVLGYRCSETRNAISTEYNARVVCRNGSRRVTYYYEQFTD